MPFINLIPQYKQMCGSTERVKNGTHTQPRGQAQVGEPGAYLVLPSPPSQVVRCIRQHTQARRPGLTQDLRCFCLGNTTYGRKCVMTQNLSLHSYSRALGPGTQQVTGREGRLWDQ